MPFSRVSSRPGDQARVSCTAGGFSTVWATGKPLKNSAAWEIVVRVGIHALFLNLVGRILLDSFCFTAEIICFFFPSVLIWFVFILWVIQSCPTLYDPIDYSPPGSFIPGILWARILNWVAIPFSRGSSRPRDQSWVSRVAGMFFTIRATREVWMRWIKLLDPECEASWISGIKPLDHDVTINVAVT